jgi:hypothetical protein
MVSGARSKNGRARWSSQSVGTIFPPFCRGLPVASSGVDDRQLPRKALPMGSSSAKLIELHPVITEGSDDADNAATLPAQQLSLRARQVLHLQMQGLPRTEIAIRLGLSEGHVGRITRSPDYIAARDVLLEREEAVLRAMKPMAFRALEDGLSSRDEYTRLQAAALYFKISGYMHHGKECEAHATGGVTAEDVCRRLLLATQPAEQAPELQHLRRSA